jgi:hypothetical protein
MSSSQTQGRRSGEGTSGLWNLIQEDHQRKEREPHARSDDDPREQYQREGEQEQREGEQEQEQTRGQG